jgi:hypothetical protein
MIRDLLETFSEFTYVGVWGQSRRNKDAVQKTLKTLIFIGFAG